MAKASLQVSRSWSTAPVTLIHLAPPTHSTTHCSTSTTCYNWAAGLAAHTHTHTHKATHTKHPNSSYVHKTHTQPSRSLLMELMPAVQSWAANAWHWLGESSTHLSPWQQGNWRWGAVVDRVLGSGGWRLTPSNLFIIMNYPYMMGIRPAGSQGESEWEHRASVCVCVCVWESERKCVCVTMVQCAGAQAKLALSALFSALLAGCRTLPWWCHHPVTLSNTALFFYSL